VKDESVIWFKRWAAFKQCKQFAEDGDDSAFDEDLENDLD
jgi:hypothetical protein